MEKNNTIIELYVKGLEKAQKADFSTGFDELDIFCKTIDAGDILAIGARPAMGKTSFAMSLVNHFLDIEKSVLFFSLSLSKEQTVQKLVSERIGVPLFYLVNGRVRQEEVEIVLKHYEDKKIEFVDGANISVDDIESKIIESKPEIVFIDYIQLLGMPKAPNLTEATNLAIKEIKRIAVENNVIVVLLSQLSRAVEARCDKHPILSDLRNGSLLEEISDVILFIYREAYYEFEKEEPRNEIIIAKNTMAPVGTVCLDFKNGFFRNRKCSDTF